MYIQLNKKTAEMVKELADSQGMTTDEVVENIIKWFVEDCNKEI
jgi:hypothetical protein